ncbi:hypothetical protein BGW42_003653 [Actinomortierella wolfii]|nr:hypothetical protein BGW42_003653 [Actinomortierella wolfii]
MLGSQAMRQIIIIGFVCFGTVGMFNAISSVGNAGKHNPTNQNLAITSSSIAYIVGFLVSGGLHNMLGPRPCIAFGGLTFILYVGAMLLAGDKEDSPYPPLAGILLGFGGGLIWVTQGAMMMSYPTEDNKGKYIGTFWAIFNLGAVVGSVLPLIMNSRPGMDPDDFSTSTYHVYMVIMAVATCLSIFLVRPSSIVKDDGEPVIVTKFQGVRAEAVAILSVFCDWRMLLLIPAFFFSNFSYTYQFNDFNGSSFNIRTRSLNSVLFWITQIVGALAIGYVLDRAPYRRPKRAMLGLTLILLLFMATWIGAFVTQVKNQFERNQFPHKLLDYEHGINYTGPLAVYAMFGFCDAAFACFCYWLMGALSNKYDDLSRYAGFFKAIQSLGSAVAAPLDLAQTPLMVYLITNWVLCAISMLAMFLVCRTITDTTIEDDDSASYYGDSIADGYSYEDGPRSIAGATEYEGESAPSRPSSVAEGNNNNNNNRGNNDNTEGDVLAADGRRRRRSVTSERTRSRGGTDGEYDEEAAMGGGNSNRALHRQSSMPQLQIRAESSPERAGAGAGSADGTPAMAEIQSSSHIALPMAALLTRTSPALSSHNYPQHYSDIPDSNSNIYLAHPPPASTSSTLPSVASPYPYLYIPPTTQGNDGNSSRPELDVSGGLGGIGGPSIVNGLGGHGGYMGIDGAGIAGVGPSNLHQHHLQVPLPHQSQQVASQRSSVGLLSATTFTSSEEEEMDDFDTRSILTVSSAGRDSIPDMGEMSPFPSSRASFSRSPQPSPSVAPAIGGGQGTSLAPLHPQYPPHLFPFMPGSGGSSSLQASSSSLSFSAGAANNASSSSSTSTSAHPHATPNATLNNHTLPRPHSPPVSISSPSSSPISSPSSSPPSSPRLNPST